MKISSFADYFSIPITTIRYYIDKDILLPVKQNSQYIFDETNIAEMEMILKLKYLSFSTEEIKQFLRIIRTYNIGDERINCHIIERYKEKKKELEKNKRHISKSIQVIDDEIKVLSERHEDPLKSGGIPFEFLEYLACPKCNESLDMSQIKITQGKIRSGHINCKCGYNATIEDGIILVNSDVSFYNTPEFKVQHYGMDQDQSDFVFFEHMKRISEETTALNLKAYAYLDAKIQEEKSPPRLIFVPDIASHYLYKYIDRGYFKEAFIVVSGFTKETIKSMKAHIDAMQQDLNIIYIANTIYDLPLKKKIFDLWIDSVSSYNFSFFHPTTTLHELVSPFFREGAAVVGLTKYMDPASKSSKFIHEYYTKCHKDNSKIDSFFSVLCQNSWEVGEKKEIGFVTNPGPYYEYVIDNEEHHYICYYAIKS